MRNFLKVIGDFFKVTLQMLGVLALIITLLWLLNPVIPGVYGTWELLLAVPSYFVFFWLVKWISKGGKNEASKAS